MAWKMMIFACFQLRTLLLFGSRIRHGRHGTAAGGPSLRMILYLLYLPTCMSIHPEAKKPTGKQ